MRVLRIPLDLSKHKVPQGEVHIIVDRCKGCGYCIEYCPNDVLEVAEEFNAQGYHPPKVKNPENCLNCGLCEVICPDYAIFTIQIGEKEAKLATQK